MDRLLAYRPRFSRRNVPAGFVLIAVCVLLFGFWLRVHRLADLPPGLSSDEAVHAIDGLQISQSGNFPMYEDFGRPEPMYNLFMALGGLFFGPHLFTFRLVSVFIGLVTIAAACWAMRQCLYDLTPSARWIAGLAAAAALAVCLSHIVLSRALYRAILQPFFMLTFLGFLLLGLRTGKRRYFILSGANLGLVLYTYTAAFAVPFSLVALLLSLLIFARRSWRLWLPNLVILSVVFAIFVVPIGLIYRQHPQAVFGRAGDVSSDLSAPLTNRVERVIAQFYERGDPNPQYNVDSVPLLPPAFRWLFVLGLAALLLRSRQPSSALLAALLILATTPVLATNEIPHGLRIMGEFAVLPLIIGLGVALLLAVLGKMQAVFAFLPFPSACVGERGRGIGGLPSRLSLVLISLLIFLITISDGAWASQTYLNYWDHPPQINMYGKQMTSTDWFFRTDRRDFGQWLTTQPGPLLVPLDEVAESTTHAWIMAAYPNVATAASSFQLPPNTRLVVPWQLEFNDIRRETRDYALLNNDVILILPPLSIDSHASLLANIDLAQAIRRANGDLMARVEPISKAIAYEQPNFAGDSLAIFGDQVDLKTWYGPDTLTSKSPALPYSLSWKAVHSPLGHYYNTFLQLQTQESQRVAGDDVLVLRWLYPTTLWIPAQATTAPIPDTHYLTVPPNLLPGAYKLVTGVYAFVDQRLPARYVGDTTPTGDSAIVGWIKVPQTSVPTVPDTATPMRATLDSLFSLRAATVNTQPDGRLHLSLYWQALVRRPNLDATIFVHLVDAQGKIVAQQDARPWGGQYPTFIWDQGETVQTDYTFDLKDVADPGVLSVEVGMYTFPDLKRLAVTQNNTPVPDGIVHLGKISTLIGIMF